MRRLYSISIGDELLYDLSLKQLVEIHDTIETFLEQDNTSFQEFEDDDLKTSVINNREVTIARLAAEDECYLAIFTKKGVTFTIQTKNLTEEELLMVLRELC